jgi:hypothetical protein
MKYSEAPAALDRAVLAAENSAQRQVGRALVVAGAKGLVMKHSAIRRSRMRQLFAGLADLQAALPCSSISATGGRSR